jgi:hypothetical protein
MGSGRKNNNPDPEYGVKTAPDPGSTTLLESQTG